MTKPSHYRPADLLPHGPQAVLLEEVLDWNDDIVSTALTVHADDRYFQPGLGVPAHLGIEWMAQTAGVFAGLEAKAAGQAVRIGFLLGTRHYRAAQSWFAAGQRLMVSAKLVFREQGMAVFDCRILKSDGEEAATARLTVYQPGDSTQDLGTQASG